MLFRQIPIIGLLSIIICSLNAQQNAIDRIPSSQREALRHSSYSKHNRNWVKSSISKQNKERSAVLKRFENQFPQIDSYNNAILIEDYDHTCKKCLSDRVLLIIGESLFVYSRNWENNEIIEEYIISDAENLLYYPSISNERQEFKSLIIDLRTSSWRDNSMKYGRDSCLDGNHSLITKVGDGNKVESLYVRCMVFQIGKPNK